MPSDLAEEDEDMRRYFGCLLADLHGRDSQRYSVSHDEAFIRPREDEFHKSRKSKVSHESHKADDSDDMGEDLGDFAFECTSQPLPPFFQFPDREGHYLKVADLRAFLHGRLDMKRLESIVDMSREDFFRYAHSCLLGHKKVDKVKTTDNEASNIVQLAQVDDAVRKMLGMESVDVAGGRRSPSPPPVSSHKSQKSPPSVSSHSHKFHKSQMSPPPQPAPPHQRLPIKPRLLAAALTSPSKGARRKQL